MFPPRLGAFDLALYQKPLVDLEDDPPIHSTDLRDPAGKSLCISPHTPRDVVAILFIEVDLFPEALSPKFPNRPGCVFPLARGTI